MTDLSALIERVEAGDIRVSEIFASMHARTISMDECGDLLRLYEHSQRSWLGRLLHGKPTLRALKEVK